jgi:hypothetical protein
MLSFGFPVEVDCSVDAAFAYVTDPQKLPEWQETAEVEQLTEGPVRAGSRFREVHVAMGRRIESITEVAAYEPDRRFDVRIVSGPVPIDASWLFAPKNGTGTRISFSASGRLTGVKRLLQPLLAVVLERQMRAHHGRLKRALEA